jgi:SAM-dependent methyltransferase
MGFIDSLNRFNARHPWSHNDAFTSFVLREARPVVNRGGRTAVDVGCGTGNLLVRLARVFPDVRGLEPDPSTAAIAAARFTNVGSVRIEPRAFQNADDAAYDFIVFVASLHHMPLIHTLELARRSLRLGGKIIVVGLANESTWADRMYSTASLVLNPVVGLLRNPRGVEQTPLNMTAPAMAPTASFEEVRRVTQGVLPGSRVRRRLFWRYTTTWTKV